MLETLLALVPHGGQLGARRNAWAAMSDGVQRARAREEADLAMAQAIARHADAAARRDDTLQTRASR